jgi:demethylmenaquinone methyltransferase/2-methoxy-6-polyprenyl-1,4-benzoquinol methylase
MSNVDRLLAEQVDYYRERAGEYEDWWFRRGRYDHGDEANAAWFAEAAEVQADLDRFEPTGRVLELACGTGLWTGRLAAHAAHVTAIDASSEALEIARAKIPAANVDFLEADLFAWEPEQTYDVCFFSFWLSHVPNERAQAFWEKVKRALAPGGRVYLIDSARSNRASARDHTLQDRGEETMLRRLADGREYHIVKHWFDADVLRRGLADLGWSAHIQTTREFFIHGHATPEQTDPGTLRS